MAAERPPLPAGWIRPAHRILPARARLRIVAAWLLAASIGATLALVLWLFASLDQSRQTLLDSLAALGFGTAVPGGQVVAVRCAEQRPAPAYGNLEIPGWRCAVAVRETGAAGHRADRRGPTAVTTQVIVVAAPVRPADAGAVVRIGGSLAVAWPGDVLLGRWWRLMPFALALLQRDGWPLSLVPDTAAWLAAEAQALRDAPRPPAPGPARDHVEAFAAVWTMGDAADGIAAIERRHRAALRLPAEEVAALPAGDRPGVTLRGRRAAC